MHQTVINRLEESKYYVHSIAIHESKIGQEKYSRKYLIELTIFEVNET